ncbi:hypothetical protein D3C81_1846470 [compost metagenome]
MPQFPVPAVLRKTALNEEMEESHRLAQARMEVYSKGREEQVQQKVDRVSWHSEGNIQQSKSVHDSFKTK